MGRTYLPAFGRNIARLRVRAGLTQEKLAEKSLITWKYLQKIEAGVHSPSLGVIIRLHKQLRCSWSDLFKGID